MKGLCEKVQSRRRIFAGALRYAALGVLAAGGFFVGVKRRRLLRQGKCINGGPGQLGCRGCGVLQQCGLPRALSAKKVLGGSGA